MERKWLIVLIVIAIVGVVGLGLFLNDYLNPINTAIREGNVDALLSYATSGTHEEKEAALEGLKEIESLQALQNGEIVHTAEQAQVVDVLISIVQNDSDMDIKEDAISTLGYIWNDKAVAFLESLVQNPYQIDTTESKVYLDTYFKQYCQNALDYINNQKRIAQM